MDTQTTPRYHMDDTNTSSEQTDVTAAWLAALERDHLADLTRAEVARALRSLSSCYVERRAKLGEGGPLASRGKRAAFALFYAPQHLLIVRAIVRSLPRALDGVSTVVDLGCGTGAAGAAWAADARARRILGYDRHPWAVAEAKTTYARFGVPGRAVQRDVTRVALQPDAATGIIAAYTINELAPDARAQIQADLLRAHARGARVLVIEPIARRSLPWWKAWQESFEAIGGRADEWRFSTPLPPTQQALARAAGLDPRELTARSLWLGPEPSSR
jgi:hypothetical protein